MNPFGIMLGGSHPSANIEIHDLVFVLADNKQEAFSKAQLKWFGDPRKVHCDAYINLKSVDNHIFSPTPNNNNFKLFAINIGGYLSGQFGEFHNYHFIIAASSKEAIDKARSLTNQSFTTPHVDNKLFVDNLIKVNEIESKTLYWQPSLKTTITETESGYFPFKSVEG